MHFGRSMNFKDKGTIAVLRAIKRQQTKKNYDDSFSSQKRILEKQSKQIAKRACLKCDCLFSSEWIGNRICPPCAYRPLPGISDKRQPVD